MDELLQVALHWNINIIKLEYYGWTQSKLLTGFPVTFLGKTTQHQSVSGCSWRRWLKPCGVWRLVLPSYFPAPQYSILTKLSIFSKVIQYNENMKSMLMMLMVISMASSCAQVFIIHYNTQMKKFWWLISRTPVYDCVVVRERQVLTQVAGDLFIVVMIPETGRSSRSVSTEVRMKSTKLCRDSRAGGVCRR